MSLTRATVEFMRRMGVGVDVSSDDRVRSGRAAWHALHSRRLGTAEWLYEWLKTIPSGCGCNSKANDVMIDVPPRFASEDDWFAWTVEYHNAINAKLGKPAMALGQARALWRDERWVQPPIDSVVAVTSLSLLPHHRTVQERCLQSWRDAGLQIIAGNATEAIAELRQLYDVQYEPVRVSRAYPRATPKIWDLMQLGRGQPILIINSDIEILGDQQLLIDAVRDRVSLLGIRHNWTEHRTDGVVFDWGIDAFLLYPEHVATFPDLDFAIGQTMWDYWVPHHLESIGAPVQWVGHPFFYHKDHPVHWNSDSLVIGRRWLSATYGMEETQAFWEQWRRSRPFGPQ